MLGFGKPKKSKPKFNNPYHIPNDRADEIRALDNRSLVERAALEYKNWLASIKIKKNDGAVLDVKEQIKNLRDTIKKDQRFIEKSDELEKLKDGLVTEEQAKLEEELKNLNQPHNEDVKAFKGVFQVAMDEVARRRETGSMKL